MRGNRTVHAVGGGHISNPLQQARLKAGMSQRAAAFALSCDKRTLQRYESGEQFPTQDVLIKMKIAYACSIDELFIVR